MVGAREEIHCLKKKVDRKYDIIEDLEHELDKSEEKLDDSKKQIEVTHSFPHGNFPIRSSTSLYSQLSPSGSASCSPAHLII